MKTTMWNADLGNGMYKNPILYADYSDPDACRAGEDYFMIASSFCNAPGLPVLHSKDLVNWKVVNYILPKVPEERYDKPVHGCGVWAPAIRYHDGTFFACFPMPDEGIYMSTTKDPFGTWSEPVNIRPGAGWIDPCPFWDEDGRAYLVAGVAKSRIGYKSVLHMIEMQPDGMGLIGEAKVVFDGNLNEQETIEGPKLYKRNGWYYIFAPAGGVKTGWQTVLRSKNIFGPYEYRVVMRQGDTPINGPHQGAWVDNVTGEDWFLHFQDVYAAGRIIHLQPMSWKEDWPIIGIAKDGNDYGEPVLTYRKPNVGEAAKEAEIFEPDASDDFSKKTLGLQWQWNANPKEDWYKLTSEGLCLKAVKQEEKIKHGDYPNLLLQKWPAPEFICDTTLSLSGLKANEEAGVISMGVKYALLSFARNEEGMVEASFINGEQKYGKILVESTEETSTSLGTMVFADDSEAITVRMSVHRVGTQNLSEKEKNFPLEEVVFEYSTNGTDYKKAGSYMAAAGRWVGVKSGVYCAAHHSEAVGSCLVKKTVYKKLVTIQSHAKLLSVNACIQTE